jgi:inosine/xanthosine triphosphatase
MEKLTIAVGGTSVPKINYLKEVLKEFGVKSSIKSIEVKSGVSDQPTTSNETKKGSINRAKGALKKINDADFSLGIEVGYHKSIKNKYEMFCWVTVIDKYKHQISGQSHKFLLPEYHQKILNSGKDLGSNLDGYSKKNNNSIDEYIENIIRHRKPFIVGALKDVLVRYFKKEDY